MSNELIDNIELLPSSSSDPNIIVSISKNEYDNEKNMLDTMYLSADILITNVISAVNFLTDNVYNQIMTNLNNLNIIMKDNDNFNNTINSSLDITKDMEIEEQMRFLGSIPQSMVDVIMVFKQYEGDYSIDLPESLQNSISNSVMTGKDNTLKQLLIPFNITVPSGSGTELIPVYDLIVFSFKEYIEYIRDNQINLHIDKLANTEMFLIPKYCSPKNFLINGELYSQYYRKLYFLDENGNIKINMLSSNHSMISKIHNLIANLSIYYKF